MSRSRKLRREQWPELAPEPPRRITKYDLVSAVIGSVFAILVSAITMTITDHYSRANLSIEYVEVLKEERRIALPNDALKDLVLSPAFRQYLNRNPQNAVRISTYLTGQESVSATEFNVLRKALVAYQTITTGHLKTWAGMKEKASGNLPQEELTSILAELLAIPAQFVPTNSDLAARHRETVARLDDEIELANESLQLADNVVAALDQAEAKASASVRFKLSVLNGGGTDGLVRNQGVITFKRPAATFPIKRSPEKKPDRAAGMTLPVTVTNPGDDPWRTTAVGKIEKNSMADLWFEIDATTQPNQERARVIALTSGGPLGEFEITLFDQDKEPVSIAWRD